MGGLSDRSDRLLYNQWTEVTVTRAKRGAAVTRAKRGATVTRAKRGAIGAHGEAKINEFALSEPQIFSKGALRAALHAVVGATPPPTQQKMS